ncbi:MAG: SGNH/GDSL hydrolase family protein, partial [Verrucomicrobia bacterium]|nr:SGNH/GDSL hydrolase family protein [Verrucomicrobiota bacterium]
MAMLLAFLLVTLPAARAIAAFSAMFVFGDGVCTTTGNTSSGHPTWYYGNRYCNGKVWIEVLSQWQGLTYEASRNISYYGHDSEALVTNTNNFTVPSGVNAATALFVVWCNNADFVRFTQLDEPPYDNSHIATWTTYITQSITRHTTAVTTLYNKGARTIVMPNAANIMAVPAYNYFASGDKTFVRDRVLQFNVAFATAMINLAASKPGLTIYRLDTFTFFEQVLANPGSYGLINPGNIDALSDENLTNKALGGPGASYVFWDYMHPTAAFQMYLADMIQQQISPVKVNSIALSGGNVYLQVANIPLGRAGFVQGSANLQLWQQEQDGAILEPFVGGNTTKTI